MLATAGLDPAGRRFGLRWRDFLRAQAAHLPAADFTSVDAAFFRRSYVVIVEAVLREYSHHSNAHGPHRSLGWRAPEAPPIPLPAARASPRRVPRYDGSAVCSTSTNSQRDGRIMAPTGNAVRRHR